MIKSPDFNTLAKRFAEPTVQAIVLKGERDETIALMTRLTQMGARIHSHTFMPLVGTPFSQSQAGVIDPQIRSFINNLQGRKLVHGRWKKQELLAKETTEFLSQQKIKRI